MGSEVSFTPIEVQEAMNFMLRLNELPEWFDEWVELNQVKFLAEFEKRMLELFYEVVE